MCEHFFTGGICKCSGVTVRIHSQTENGGVQGFVRVSV